MTRATSPSTPSAGPVPSTPAATRPARVRELVIPALAAEFSAFGAIASEVKVMVERDILPGGLHESLDRVNRGLEQLEGEARRQLSGTEHLPGHLGDGARATRTVGLRFYRQIHRIDLALEAGPLTPGQADLLIEAFRQRYERMVGAGTARDDTPVEVVNLGVHVVVPVPPAALPVRAGRRGPAGADPRRLVRRGPGALPGATVGPPWGRVRLSRARRSSSRRSPRRSSTRARRPSSTSSPTSGSPGRDRRGAQRPAVSPVLLEIIRHRLNNINDDAASTLKRVSGSQIAVEASDLNTVIMAADGRVVACGRYVLIQVASMHLVVSFLLEHYADNPGIAPGDQFITNDPYVGTLHQPDVVLAAPIFVDGTLVAWCASVVHQSDVGGPTPGGSPTTPGPSSTRPSPWPRSRSSRAAGSATMSSAST